ncbi:transposase [Micromonospora sp. RTP1Z1]|uniref:transposase n=1 Tax=Micromonospora sp. RTP1Z1 TaxID=2994043 RepID=UPI0029C97712|nr:transposase [Micromonospora sp. RTP1Z1]
MCISRRYQNLVQLTSLTGPQLSALVVRVAAALPPTTGRPWKLSLTDRILVTCAAVRTNLTTRALAAVFRISQAMVVRVLRHLLPVLAGLPRSRHRPGHGRRCTWIIDGTLIPAHDQQRAAPSKNYRRSVNLQVVVRRCDRSVVAAGVAWPGNRNDIVVARAQPGLLAAAPRQILGDGAYRSLPGVTTPTRHQNGRIIRDDAWRRHRRRRATVEHVIARLKDWQMLRQIRRRGDQIDHVIGAAVAIYNHRLDQLRLNS